GWKRPFTNEATIELHVAWRRWIRRFSIKGAKPGSFLLKRGCRKTGSESKPKPRPGPALSAPANRARRRRRPRRPVAAPFRCECRRRQKSRSPRRALPEIAQAYGSARRCEDPA